MDSLSQISSRRKVYFRPSKRKISPTVSAIPGKQMVNVVSGVKPAREEHFAQAFAAALKEALGIQAYLEPVTRPSGYLLLQTLAELIGARFTPYTKGHVSNLYI